MRKKTERKKRWLCTSTVRMSPSTSVCASPVSSSAAPSGMVPASSSSEEASSDATASPGRRQPVMTIRQAPASARVTIGMLGNGAQHHDAEQDGKRLPVAVRAHDRLLDALDDQQPVGFAARAQPAARPAQQQHVAVVQTQGTQVARILAAVALYAHDGDAVEVGKAEVDRPGARWTSELGSTTASTTSCSRSLIGARSASLNTVASCRPLDLSSASISLGVPDTSRMSPASQHHRPAPRRPGRCLHRALARAVRRHAGARLRCC